MIEDFLQDADASRSGEMHIRLRATFHGSPPSLHLLSDSVQRLAAVRGSIAIALEHIDESIRTDGTFPPHVPIPPDLRVAFWVRGQFDPNRFGAAVGLRATRMVMRETPRPIPARFSLWVLDVGPVKAREFPQTAADAVLAEIVPRARLIRDALREMKLEARFDFAATCAQGGLLPSVVITSQQIAQVALMGCALDYSVILPRSTDSWIIF